MPFSNGFLLSLSLCLDIGIANIAMMTLAMQRGFAQGFLLGVGTCIGDLIYAMLAMAGMTVLLHIEPVRWALWIGGSVILTVLSIKMLGSALKASPGLEDKAQQPKPESRLASLSRGIFLAMSSPSAILWFAAVGGAIIAKQGRSMANISLFLTGFFMAGLFWAVVLCGLARQGGKLMGAKMLKISYLASALIFIYFAVYVVYSGYTEFVLHG